MFDATYNKPENLLVCAPTGAGGTNVATMDVVSHLRDLGLVGAAFHDMITTVKEGRSAREEDSVHHHDEGTGPGGGGEVLCQVQAAGDQGEGAYRDIQLSRTEAEAAYILVTTQKKWDVMALKGGGDPSARRAG